MRCVGIVSWSCHLAGGAGVVAVDVVSKAAAISVVSINMIQVLLGLTKVRSSTAFKVCVWLHGTWLLLQLSPCSLSSAVAPTLSAAASAADASTTSLLLLLLHWHLHLHHGLLYGGAIHYLSSIVGALSHLQL